MRVYPELPPKRKLVAELVLSDYKKIFLYSAKEIAQECGVSEPTITRFAVDLGFSGFAEFEQYLKGLLHIELTSVERMQKTSLVSGVDEEGPVLTRFCQGTMESCQRLMHSITPEEVQRLAKNIKAAPAVVVAGHRASSSLVQYFGYLLQKIRPNVMVDTDISWAVHDHLALHGPNVLLVAIAFPRYSQRTVDLLDYARHFECRTLGISDTPLSPVVTRSDLHAVLDIEGISFIDPFGSVITFLGALSHEVAFLDKDATLSRLKKLERGIARRGDFFKEDSSEPARVFDNEGDGPLEADFYLKRIK